MKKRLSKMCLGCLFFYMFVSCSDNDNGKQGGSYYDPNKPVEITTFMPDSGGVQSKFIVCGNNFGTDVSKIKVIFDGNREATIISSDGTSIYCMIPRQEPGDNKVSVVVDENVKEFDKTFRYTQQERVSLVAGKFGSFELKDGTLTEARFNAINGIGIVDGDNYLLSEPYAGNIRYVSPSENKVVTVAKNIVVCKPAVSKDGTKAYYIGWKANQHAVYCLEKATLWAPQKILGGIPECNKGEIYAVALDNTDKWLYYRGHDGTFGRLNVEKPSERELLMTNCGNVAGGLSYITYNPHEDCFYLSVSEMHGIYKITKDADGRFTKCTEYAGFNRAGAKDGTLDEAQFNLPRGMDVDSDNNLYVTDRSNYTIRKITPDGYVSTVAGQPGLRTNPTLNGDPFSSTFWHPTDLAVDSEENVIITEQDNCELRKYAFE